MDMAASSPLAVDGLAPAFGEPRAVVMACNARYAAPLGVMLTSLIANASEGNRYDLIVLWPDNEGEEERARLALAAGGRKNVSLRHVDMRAVWAELKTVGPEDLHPGHDYSLPPQTYYRLFAGTILKRYARVLYLDADMVVLEDVAELMGADLAGRALGAARDHWAVRVLRQPYGRFLGWLESLELERPDNYFNAGVLVMDLNRWRDLGLEGRCVDRLKAVKAPRYHDQDILNHVCQHELTLLDPAWNSLAWWGEAQGDPDHEATLPEDLQPEYFAAKRKPKIIHYLNSRKPWLTPWNRLPLAARFWPYAEKSPFFAELKAGLL